MKKKSSYNNNNKYNKIKYNRYQIKLSFLNYNKNLKVLTIKIYSQ